MAFILLAAGGSSRMGRPKQFLPWRGRSLLRRAAEAALASPCRPVYVVVGAHAEAARAELAGLDVRVVDNPAWGDGIGSSVRAGVAAASVAVADGPDAVLIGLCDQPHVGTETFTRLVEARAAGKGIIAAAYGGGAGVPALFDRAYFPELRALPDDVGAKKLIRLHANDVHLVCVPSAERDVDTPGDYKRLGEEVGKP